MSEVKVNKISPRTNCGTTTLGDSGDTFTIPAGVSITNNGTASGFGATGAASWNTTVKTSTFTAVAGEGYFVNTTGGTITVNLPAGTAGAVVAIKDYAGTFDTNAVTLNLNGSDKAGGSTDNPILDTEGTAVTLVYVDSTQGWLVTDDGLQSSAEGPKFVAATGGTITTVCTNFKVHTFTSPGTFTVTCAGNAGGSNSVDYQVSAGGGGGGSFGGGGGGGGFRESKVAATSGCWTASPIAATTSLTVCASGYPITVGAGGAGGCCGSPQIKGVSGSNSVFSTITSAGGGGGGGNSPAAAGPHSGEDGGSGGGASNQNATGNAGNGNSPSVSPPQGSNGGTGGGSAGPHRAGGGGGATAVGGNGTGGGTAGAGGTGATSSITSSPVARAGGGGGGSGANCTGGAGSPCGTGKPGAPSPPDKNAAANTSGGGGGGHNGPNRGGGSGGSGIVIIRYKFQ